MARLRFVLLLGFLLPHAGCNEEQGDVANAPISEDADAPQAGSESPGYDDHDLGDSSSDVEKPAARIRRLTYELVYDDEDVRARAEQSLVESGRAAIPHLCSVLGDEQVGIAARGVLIKIGTPAIPSLSQMVNHPRFEAQHNAATALLTIDPQVNDPATITAVDWGLREHLQDEDRPVWALLAASLRNLQRADAVPVLLSALENKRAFENHAFSRLVTEALLRIGPEAAAPYSAQIRQLIDQIKSRPEVHADDLANLEMLLAPSQQPSP